MGTFDRATRNTKRSALVFTAVLLLIFLPSVTHIPVSAQATPVSSKTLIVPNEYPSIADAVGNASQGDIVFVENGTFRGNILINKSISIIGSGKGNTIIIGNGGNPNTYVFNVTADNVEISGFTIESTNYSNPALLAGGIAIAQNNCTITDNNIENVYRGIYVGGWGNISGTVSQTTIADNNITSAVNDGILLYGGSNNVISGNTLETNNGSAITLTGYSNIISNNTIQFNYRGIGTSTSYSVICGNNITNNTNWGIYLENSNNIIVENCITNNRWGIYLSPYFAPENNTFYHNNFINNTKQVSLGSPDSTQTWDNGSPNGGNYWSNYTGVTDTPFVIGPNNADNYPLTSPFDISNVGVLPPANQPSSIQNNNVAVWPLDSIEPDGITPDATGNNPIILSSSPGPQTPNLVPGKFGQALNFSFNSFGVALASPSLDVSGELTIDVWIKVTALENTTYNNILVQTAGSLNTYSSRIYGLAINGLSSNNATACPVGAVIAYITTTSGFNQIVTLTSAVKLNQWTNIVFVRSLTTGMHIYVNGVEQPVVVTSGSQNPTGNIVTGNELFVGHDFSGDIQRLSISNIDKAPKSIDWSFMLIITPGVAVASIAGVYLHRKSRRSKQMSVSHICHLNNELKNR